MSNYYEDQSISTIERVVLAEDIVLPTLPNYPLTHDNLKLYGEYKLAFNEYRDVVGKFFLNIMTPLVNKDSTYTQNQNSPSTKGHKGSLATTNYQSSNYISLKIPKYILLNFRGTIPKGTEFIIASIGGSIDVDDMRIIGIY